jgi:hypothetical protein
LAIEDVRMADELFGRGATQVTRLLAAQPECSQQDMADKIIGTRFPSLLVKDRETHMSLQTLLVNSMPPLKPR